MRRKFFTHRMVRPWHMLPRVTVDAPYPEVFKATLDGALGSLSWWVAGWCKEVAVPRGLASAGCYRAF